MTGERRKLWAGRSLALIGIVLVAVNLRTAVAALSPIYDVVDADLHGGAFGLGILGMLPPLCFALFGILTPSLSRRFGLEKLLVGALLIMVLGHVLRGLAGSFAVLLLGSILCFAAIGAGNVVLPPLVKKYFTDRIGQITAAYATVMSISTFVPPLVAVPLAERVSWQFSLAIWALFAIGSVVPWLFVIRRGARQRRLDPAIAQPSEAPVRSVVRSRTAWAITIVFAASSSVAYTCFAWLPQTLQDISGVSPATGGVLLSLFGFMGLPAALVMPVLAARSRRPALLAWAGALCILVGVGGLLAAPTAAWLWVAVLGSGPLLFPLALTLINLRSRSHQTAIAASGFVQGVGYTVAALFPLLFGVLHQATGGWTLPLVVLGTISIPVFWAGRVLGEKRFIDAAS